MYFLSHICLKLFNYNFILFHHHVSVNTFKRTLKASLAILTSIVLSCHFKIMALVQPSLRLGLLTYFILKYQKQLKKQ